MSPARSRRERHRRRSPLSLERNAAPIQILNSLNGLAANFYCWPGAANVAGTALVPSAPSPIATVTVIGGEPTLQPFACFSPLTSSYATFPLPLTGTGAPDPIDAGGSTTFSGLSTAFGVDAALVVAGIGAGVLDFVTDPVLLGSPDPNSGGGDGVNAVANQTTARYNTSNTTDTSHEATGGVTATFWVVFDGADLASVLIYAEDSPGSWDGSGTDGLHVTPSVVIPILLSPSITVTHTGGGSPHQPLRLVGAGAGQPGGRSHHS